MGILIAAPAVKSTINIIDLSMLSLMKPTGVLLNIARAQIVNEDALYKVLSEKVIGGAILDVWWNDFSWVWPGSAIWPSKYDFSKLDNVVMTPHASAATAEAHEEAITQAAANFDALALGEP